MKAKILTKINLVLGVLAMFFAGCHSQARVVRDRGPIAKYGVPQEVLDRQKQEQNADGRQVEEQQLEEVPDAATPDRQPRKYGPVPPRNK